MAFHFYRHFLRQSLAGFWQGTAAFDAGAPAAAPVVTLTGVTAAYVFAYTHTVEADFAAYATEVVYTLAGENATQVRLVGGVLHVVDGGPGVLASPAGTTAGLVLWVDHGSWVQLVGYWDDFVGAPFAPVAGDSPTVEWPRLGHRSFELLPVRGVGLDDPMLYPYMAEQVLGALLGGSTRTELVPSGALTCDLVSFYGRMVWSHRYLADIPAAWWAIGPEVGDPQAIPWADRSTAYVADGAQFLVSGEAAFVAPSGQDAFGLLFWQATGDPATSLLVGICPVGLVPLYGEDVSLPFTQGTGVIELGSP